MFNCCADTVFVKDKNDPKRQRSVNMSASSWEKVHKIAAKWKLSDSRMIEIMVRTYDEARQPAPDSHQVDE